MTLVALQALLPTFDHSSVSRLLDVNDVLRHSVLCAVVTIFVDAHSIVCKFVVLEIRQYDALVALPSKEVGTYNTSSLADLHGLDAEDSKPDH